MVTFPQDLDHSRRNECNEIIPKNRSAMKDYRLTQPNTHYIAIHILSSSFPSLPNCLSISEINCWRKFQYVSQQFSWYFPSCLSFEHQHGLSDDLSHRCYQGKAWQAEGRLEWEPWWVGFHEANSKCSLLVQTMLSETNQRSVEWMMMMICFHEKPPKPFNDVDISSKIMCIWSQGFLTLPLCESENGPILFLSDLLFNHHGWAIQITWMSQVPQIHPFNTHQFGHS